MKPIGDYVKIEKLPKKDEGKILTTLDSGNGNFEQNEGILASNLTVEEKDKPSWIISGGAKVVYTNPVYERKEGEKSYVFVHRKFVIAYEQK